MNGGPREPRRYARCLPWLVIGSLVLGLMIGAPVRTMPPSAVDSTVDHVIADAAATVARAYDSKVMSGIVRHSHWAQRAVS